MDHFFAFFFFVEFTLLKTKISTHKKKHCRQVNWIIIGWMDGWMNGNWMAE